MMMHLPPKQILIFREQKGWNTKESLLMDGGNENAEINLRKEIGTSRLDLRGTIEPFSDFFKSLPGTQDTVKLFKRRLKRGTLSFTIRGTLTEPSIQFT